MLRPLSVTSLALVSLVVPPAAAAEPIPKPSSPSTDPTLTDHVRRGDMARRAARWREAAAAYADALATAERAGLPEKKLAAIVGELGAAEVALGRFRDGAAHLHRSLPHEDDLPAEQRARFRGARAKAAGQVAVLIIAVNPPDAKITVDAKPALKSPSSHARDSGHVLFLEPGQHTIRAGLPGFDIATFTLNMEKGSKIPVSLRLQRQAAPQPAAAIPCAAPVGKVAQPCPPARDWVADFRTGAFITAGVGTAVGAVLLIATVPVNSAILNHVDTFGKREGNLACKNPNPSNTAECEAQQARLRARAWLTGAGWVTLGVSGMIATAAASSYFWADSKKDAAPVRVTAITTGDYTGAAVLGAW